MSLCEKVKTYQEARAERENIGSISQKNALLIEIAKLDGYTIECNEIAGRKVWELLFRQNLQRTVYASHWTPDKTAAWYYFLVGDSLHTVPAIPDYLKDTGVVMALLEEQTTLCHSVCYHKRPGKYSVTLDNYEYHDKSLPVAIIGAIAGAKGL